MSDYGAGWSLDEQFDLDLDPASGDLKYSEGDDELIKDLSLNLTRALDPAVGAVMTDGQQADVRNYAERVMRADPRVESAQASVTFETREDTLLVDAEITTSSETIEKIFEI